MTQNELIAKYPLQNSIVDRVLLIGTELLPTLVGVSISDCRIFLIVTKGSMTINIGNEMRIVTRGNLLDLLIWNPVTIVDMSGDLEGWCLLPNYKFTNEALNDMKPASSESFKNPHSIPVLTLTERCLATIDTLLKVLASTLSDTDHFYRAEICQSHFRSIMLEIGNAVLKNGEATQDSHGIVSRKDKIIIGFFKLVWRYYKAEHNIDFYAERLCVSSKHLSRVIKEKIGKTPYAVIQDELIQYASFLLRETKMPVQEIATELHFSEMASFCKFFKKHSGVSPTTFRSSGHSDVNKY